MTMISKQGFIANVVIVAVPLTAELSFATVVEYIFLNNFFKDGFCFGYIAVKLEQ